MIVWWSTALAFPDPSAREMAVPLGGGAGRGTFTADAAGLGFARAAAGDLQYWLGDATLGDGLVRARVVLGKKPDFTLLFRASQTGGDPFALRAYGVSIENDAVVPYRFELGGVRALGAGVPVEGLEARAALEIVVQATGPTFVATVWDADTLALLATVTATDAELPTGQVGWRVHPGQGADTRLASLAVLPAGAPAAPVAAVFGKTRWVELDPAERAKLPADLGAEVVIDEPAHLVLKTDPIGLERMRRRGVAVRWVSADDTWWMRDARYRAVREDPESVVRDGIHLDLSYKNPDMVHAILKALAARHADVARVVVLGTTWAGRPIEALRVTDDPSHDENEPTVLLVASHHGGELLATEYALDALSQVLERRKTDPRVARWVSDLDLWFVPLVNPDGAATYLEVSTDADRKNGRDLDGDGVREPWEGVDLNRNYPFAWGALGEGASSSVPASGKYRGPSAASEPETKALVDLANRRSPVAVISWHTAANKILSPYTVDGRTPPSPDAAWPVAEELAARAGRQASGRMFTVARNLYPVDGTDQDWHRFAHGSLAYIVEGSHQNPKDPDVIAASIRGTRPVFETLLDRVLAGPRLVVQVRDPSGKPLVGTVRLTELVTSEGETWNSRAADGRFDLMLAAAGEVTLHVEARGYKPFERRVKVEGVTEVVVELRPDRGG